MFEGSNIQSSTQRSTICTRWKGIVVVRLPLTINPYERPSFQNWPCTWKSVLYKMLYLLFKSSIQELCEDLDQNSAISTTFQRTSNCCKSINWNLFWHISLGWVNVFRSKMLVVFCFQVMIYYGETYFLLFPVPTKLWWSQSPSTGHTSHTTTLLKTKWAW